MPVSTRDTWFLVSLVFRDPGMIILFFPFTEISHRELCGFVYSVFENSDLFAFFVERIYEPFKLKIAIFVVNEGSYLNMNPGTTVMQ